MDRRKTENLKIPLPILNGDNNHDYFTDVFSTIDRNAANEEDLKKLREEVESSLQAKNVKISDKELNFQSGDVEGALTELANENKKQSQILVDGLKAENINTTQSYQGSSKDIESALSSISKEVDRHKYANGIRIRDARNNFKSTEVEGALTELATKQNAHSQRTDNPHRVTKTQVGLSNVDNVKQATKTEHNALKNRVDNLHAKDIAVTSTNLKSTDVAGALDELFTYADDVHARWASSIGAPLNQRDTAETKERKTLDLIMELNNANGFKGVLNESKTLRSSIEEVYNITPKTIHDTYIKNSKAFTLDTYDEGYSNRGLMVVGELKSTDIIHSHMVGNVGTSKIFNINIVPEQFNGYEIVPIEGKTSIDSKVIFKDENTVEFCLFYKQGQADKVFRFLYFGDVVKKPSLKRVPKNMSDPQADKMWEEFKKEHGY